MNIASPQNHTYPYLVHIALLLFCSLVMGAILCIIVSGCSTGAGWDVSPVLLPSPNFGPRT